LIYGRDLKSFTRHAILYAQPLNVEQKEKHRITMSSLVINQKRAARTLPVTLISYQPQK
jgi:hypothetical protein